VLFYTSGVELRRLLPAAEATSFTPYAYQNGVYTRGDWPKYERVLEKDWQRYLDSKTSFQTAIQSMVVDLQWKFAKGRTVSFERQIVRCIIAQLV
jgi:hypothetical protein